MRGSDLRYDLTIAFEEAAFGAKKQIVVPRLDECKECKGSGLAAGATRIGASASLAIVQEAKLAANPALGTDADSSAERVG